ncbi:MAG TPA: type II secretory pathway, component PulD, partial [Isosphaeraceae bacterium]
LVAQARQALATGRVDEARGLARRADALGAAFDAAEDSPAKLLAEIDPPGAASGAESVVRGGPADAKARARWLLMGAREQMHQGHYDDAADKLAEARRLNVRWRLFDDITPDKVEDELRKTRTRSSTAGGAGAPHTRPEAKARLQEARAALESNQYDQAESLALEVGSWGLAFGMFEDSPTKIASAARALRRRDTLRATKGVAQPSQELYDLLVRDARELMAAGRLQEAEAKARQAQRMNVVPAVTADRAEAVLNDLATALASAASAAPAPADPAAAAAPPAAVVPIAEPLSAALEREANELLAHGQRDAAAAKFTDAERQRAQEIGQAYAAAHPTAAPANHAVVATAATTPTEPAQPPLISLEPAPGPGVEPEVRPATADGASAPTPTADANPGPALLEQARQLLASGNFPAAKQAANQAKAGGFGLEAQADELLAQIALAEQGGALKLYEAALDALRKNEPARARALLGEVAALGDLLDEGLMQRVQDLLLKLPKDKADAGAAPPATDALAAQTDAEAVKAQQLNAEVGTKVAEARQLLETDPEKAIALLTTTIETVRAAGLSSTVARTMVRRLEVAIELAKKDKVAFEAKMQDKRQRAEIEQKRIRILEAGKAKQERVKQLMEKAQAAMAEGKFAEAEGYAKQAQEIAPNEVAPGALATVARVRRHYELDKRIRSDKEDSYLNDLQAVDASSIIPDDTRDRGIGFPKSFPELTERRRRAQAELEPKKSASNLRIEAKLNEPVSVNLDKQPLGEAMEFLRNYTGLNVVPDTKAYLEEGLTSDTPVSLTVNNVKLKIALKLMLQPLGLTYKIEDEVLLITTPQSRSRMYAVTYPVADLVMAPSRKPRDPASALALATPVPGVTNPAGGPQAQPEGSGPAAALMGAGSGQAPVGPAAGRPDVDMTPLIQLIATTIAPGTWRVGDGSGDPLGGGFGQGAGMDAGGGIGGAGEQAIGSITPFYLNISLIIRQTAEVHDQIVDLLRQLRRLQDLQVSVEVRFITVDDNFFEQIGIDFDFSIQSDVVGRKSSFAVPNPAAVPGGAGTGTGGGGTAGVTPFLINPSRDHSIGPKPLVVGRGGSGGTGNFTPDLQIPFLQDTINASTTALASGAGAATSFGIAFLSDLELYLFLQALQGDTRSNIVQAPKVTSFNGAPAYIANTTQRNYIAGLNPIVNAGAIAFTPQIGSIPDGVQLLVTPVVSADRRYVRLTLAPTFIAFNRFDSFPVAGGVGGGGLGGGATNVSGTIQVPTFNLTTVDTTVTVPDGGTVLLGGVKILSEQRNEFGTPILSKTPLINRLFRNIGIARQSRSLMLMVTPRIIILEEEEERLGIPAVQSPTF